MAALKISNSINQHYQQQNQEPLTPVQSSTPNMPFTAQSPQSDTSTVTTTNNNYTPTNTINSNTMSSMTTKNSDSPDASLTDEISSRQVSVDAGSFSSNDYQECAMREPNQTLSSSTSGIPFAICPLPLLLFCVVSM